MLSDVEKVLQKRMRECTASLRSAYHIVHANEPIENVVPFGGEIHESIGAFPEYILRGHHCRRSIAGLCSPCFYSRFPKQIGKEYSSLLRSQIDYIIDNFDSSVVKRCYKSYYCSEKMPFPDNETISCAITPVGSFFDETELPVNDRLYLFKRLIDLSADKKINIILYVESHVEDFLKWSPTYDEIILMKQLNLRIVFGFESRNDYVRNILYTKQLDICDFEAAVEKAKQYDFGTYAFVFFGLSPMTHDEILADADNSFSYLIEQNVVPVVMFANTQDYTIPAVLKMDDAFNYINPITVLEIINKMIAYFGRYRQDGLDAWLIANPVGGPPEPSEHLFSNTKFSFCNDKIYKLINNLRMDHEYPLFDEEYRDIHKCIEFQLFYNQLQIIPCDSLTQRTMKMINYVEAKIPDYLKKKNIDELALIKAHLLCEGAKMDDNTRRMLEYAGISEGFVHSPNLMIDDIPINACILTQFVESPSCEIRYYDGKYYLTYNNKKDEDVVVREATFITIPEWGKTKVDGYQVSDYLRPHSKKCISIWPNLSCAFGTNKCKFCSLEDGITLPIDTASKMVDIALSYGGDYEVNLGGGVFRDFKGNEDYFAKLASLIHYKHPNTAISLETIPPCSEDGIYRYYQSGIRSILFNIEIPNERIRKEICPGKGTLPIQHYLTSFRTAVKCFGKWNVGTVIIYGIPGVTDFDIIQFAQLMCEIGVMPVIMPFQPLCNSLMKNCVATDPKSFLQLSINISNIQKRAAQGDNTCGVGCLKCGGCSLETVLNC